jgi:hypothetical protein
LDAEGLEALLSPEGLELQREVASEDVTPRTELSVSARLRRRHPPRLVAAGLELAELRGRARSKFDRAADMYFTREGLEQASTEVVGRHRARRFEGARRVADLCAGIGGDLLSLAAGRAALAVDQDPLHLRMAGLNAGVYGADADLALRAEDVRETDLGGVDAVWVDPARRRAGRRELHPEDSSPPLSWAFELARRIPAVGVKAAPGLGLEVLPPGWEAELISVRGDLKEAALWSPALATASRRATLLPGGHTLLPAPGEPVACAPPARYALDPDPAVTRAGLVEELARELGAWKLDPRIAFLCSDSPMRTPFGRLLVVEESMPWALKPLRAKLRELDVGAVDVRKRGSAVDVEELRRRLKLRGSRRVTVLLTRVLDRPWALVCSDPPGE